MAIFIFIILFTPLLFFTAGVFAGKTRERLLSALAYISSTLQLISCFLLLIFWTLKGAKPFNVKEFTIYENAQYSFYIDFYIDQISMVFLLTGSFLSMLITIYSRYYMHRESGYKRFFLTILMFSFGYSVTVISGNYETLFVGWEILGLSSFLLIAFYRDRYLPVKNAVKVFSIYRIGDVGLILAMWMSHHLWHENVAFVKLNDPAVVDYQLLHHSMRGIFIASMLLLAASAKSAQFPFSSWLPRAMEGPTPSSAIFYGSLSVHLGVFLMLRSYTFIEHQYSVRILIALVGIVTSLLCTGISRVQSNAKSQIAYASAAQIGLMFVEIAAGWQTLALIHFAGNAFLRTYQLLVSPSIVSYLIREQFYHFSNRPNVPEDILPKSLKYKVYLACLREWWLDDIMYNLLWNPLKWVGNQLSKRLHSMALLAFVILFIGGVVLSIYQSALPSFLIKILPVVFSFIGLVLVLRSFAERKNALHAFGLVVMNHFWLALAISFNDFIDINDLSIYMAGVIPAGILGWSILYYMKQKKLTVDLLRFQGQSVSFPVLNILFLVAILGVSGFPITSTFIGEDVFFSHIQSTQYVLATLMALCLIIDGIALIRIYARLFMGPAPKNVNEIPYRSS